MKKCKNCGKETNHNYCSAKCLKAKVKDPYKVKCKSCGLSFRHHDLRDIRIGKIKYCSRECAFTKHKVNYRYFDVLTEEKLFTFGQILTYCYYCTHSETDHSTIDIIIINDEKTIKEITDKISFKGNVSRYLEENRDDRKIIIKDSRLGFKLISMGISKRSIYQEMPPYDWEILVKGMLSTGFYREVDGQRILELNSHKLALAANSILKGEIKTKLFRVEGAMDYLRIKYIIIF